MSTATVAEVITQERANGKTDHQIAGLLRASKLLPLPPGNFYCWSIPAVRAAVGEDAGGYRLDNGTRGSANHPRHRLEGQYR